MSGIPERLWHVICGHWEVARERLDDAESLSGAYDELAAHIRAHEPDPAIVRRTPPGVLPAPNLHAPGGRDPLAVSYDLLGVSPGGDLAGLEKAYHARLVELEPEKFAAGSAQRQVIEGRRQAVVAAYEKLRDILNPTETRFEKIEF